MPIMTKTRGAKFTAEPGMDVAAEVWQADSSRFCWGDWTGSLSANVHPGPHKDPHPALGSYIRVGGVSRWLPFDCEESARSLGLFRLEKTRRSNYCHLAQKKKGYWKGKKPFFSVLDSRNWRGVGSSCRTGGSGSAYPSFPKH